MIGGLFRLWRTVSHLRLSQVYGRLKFNLFKPRPNLEPAPSRRAISAPWYSAAPREPSLNKMGEFIFLNEKGSLNHNGWDDPTKSKLWRYNQHYFDDLNARDAETRAKQHRALIIDWISFNLPGQGTGWEPYPTSLRIVNWIKWILVGNTPEPQMIQSLAVQTRWLSRRLERHLLGNHLFVNAKALVYAGLFFDGPEAQRWLQLGTKILEKEISEQILRDGGQFELSPMYHALAVEDMLDLVNIACVFEQDTLAKTCGKRVPLMLRWLVTMTHPDGTLASFNDTASGIAPSVSILMKYAKTLGFDVPSYLPDRVHLINSGYARLEKGPAVLITDLAKVGPDYLPGHAHADTLSFELSLHGKRVVVNSGTSVYGVSQERIRQRGTAAHSTLTIDGQNSSEVWSGFRVGRRARPLDVRVEGNGTEVRAEGAHDGYRYLKGKPLHRRHWKLTPTGLSILDQIESRCSHEVIVRFHLAEGYHAESTTDGTVHILSEQEDEVLIFVAEGARTSVIESTLHPQFGITVPNYSICLFANTWKSTAIKSQLNWGLL